MPAAAPSRQRAMAQPRLATESDIESALSTASTASSSRLRRRHRPAASCAVRLLALGGATLAARGASAQQAPAGGGSPFAVVARQLAEDECPDGESWAIDAWATLQAHFFEAQAVYSSPQEERRRVALDSLLRGLGALMDDLRPAYQCPVLCTRYFSMASQWSLALGHGMRARALIQMGNIFKLQAMSRWWTKIGVVPGAAPAPAPAVGDGKRYETRMQVEYTIAVTQLHEALQAPLRPLVKYNAGWGGQLPKVEIHSICTYKPDPTSNTGDYCPLPELSVPNHKAYAQRHGYHYVLHTELPLPEREAHYSKMLVIHEAMRSERAPDWVFFVDCDAFFTNMEVSIPDILATYGAAGAGGPHFLVAEDPGGINTGTLLFRRSEWSIAFLERVAACQFGIAWDQSMFFWEVLRPTLLQLSSSDDPVAALTAGDLVLPTEVAFVHQAHMNAFVPPASRDWSAYEWQRGDFVRHFAGCPWQEQPCLTMMRETAALMAQYTK